VHGHTKKLWIILQKKLEKLWLTKKQSRAIIEKRKDIHMTIEDMAKAHLETVRKAVNDLLAQKDKIDSEIARLKEYITTGESVILNYQHVSSLDSKKEVEIRGL
jgi:plasmid maintenance system antidote protein VapI